MNSAADLHSPRPAQRHHRLQAQQRPNAPSVEPAGAGVAGRLWQSLRQRVAPQPLPLLRVQHLVLADDDVEPVRTALHAAGADIGLRLELDSRDGDIVLLDRDLAGQISTQLIEAFSEGRPCITISRTASAGLPVPTARCDLREQLLALPLVHARFRSPRLDASAEMSDSGFDTLWDLEAPLPSLPPIAQARVQRELQLLQLVARRRSDERAAPLRAHYGPQARLHLDFRAARALAEPAAAQALRLQRELPRLAPDTMPLDEGDELPLDHVLWDLGAAAAQLPLLAAPEGWWKVPLLAPDAAAGSVHTRVPSRLEVLRCLAEGPVSPAELRRLVRISVIDLRRVLQPLLLLGLAHWSPVPSPIHPGVQAWKPATPDSNPTPQPVSSC